MLSRLSNFNIVCSKSVDGFLEKYSSKKRFVVDGKCSYRFYKENFEKLENVCAIGGGSVIDKAKIISKGPIELVIPTTASGSSQTSHSVVWKNNKKLSVSRFTPKKTYILEELLVGVPKSVMLETKIDMISHFFDSVYNIESCYPNVLKNVEFKNLSYSNIVRWGIVAGDYIQKNKTTVLHGLSYFLTSKFSLTHGQSLSVLLPYFFKLENIDMNKHFNQFEISSFVNFNDLEVKTDEFIDFSLDCYFEKIKKYKRFENDSKNEVRKKILELF